jgi:hypothetical protein
LEKNLFAADLRWRAQMGKSGFTAETRRRDCNTEEGRKGGSGGKRIAVIAGIAGIAGIAKKWKLKTWEHRDRRHLEKNLFAADLRRRAQMGKSGFIAEARRKILQTRRKGGSGGKVIAGIAGIVGIAGIGKNKRLGHWHGRSA